ncbi:hypothetical protein [Marinobacter sp.]|jgi:multisubunit Na+/H+ antiporter MnhB subunit|uniref:hypothetical protein n=1 Tax=Marinobacter sp. TaxID=50741 RepID=UPI00261B5733|nr:hypothetical protein [Marinobacter sp.]
MFLTIFIVAMAVLFAALTFLTISQGPENLLRSIFNGAMVLFCAGWAGYRFVSGQHPVTHPTLLTEKQIAEISALISELEVSMGAVVVAVILTMLTVWAVFDAASRRH